MNEGAQLPRVPLDMEVSFYLPASLVEWPKYFRRLKLPVFAKNKPHWRSRYAFLPNDDSRLILDVDVHDCPPKKTEIEMETQTERVHWVLKVSRQPSSEPPDYVKTESALVGGAENFLNQVALEWVRLAGPTEVSADVTYVINADEWERRIAGIEVPVARSPGIAGLPDDIILEPLSSAWSVSNHPVIRRLMIVPLSGKRSFAVTAQGRYSSLLQSNILNQAGERVWQELRKMLEGRT